MKNTLSYYVEKYGSDKVDTGHAELYDRLFANSADRVTTLLEIGIGTSQLETLDIDDANSRYKTGGSLKAWKDFFPTAKIYGIDVVENFKFEEDRIQTFIFSSWDKVQCEKHFKDNSIDVIIDDGINTGIGQLLTMYNLFHKVSDGGFYIIENCGESDDGTNIFIDFEKNFKKIADEHEYYFGGNFIAIRKNKSGLGQIFDFAKFCELGAREIEITKNLTVVSGLWDIGREGRSFDHYIENFKKFLSIPVNLFLFLPKELEYLVWENKVRTNKNTYIRNLELSEIKNNLYNPFWNKTQEIRTNSDWYNLTGEHGWLKNSPQALNKWYNPVVQSKMFMLHDAKILDVFETDYFIWLDAGITNTVPEDHFIKDRCLDRITEHLNSFLFLSYPYEANGEIHGFKFDAMNRYSNDTVKYVCRGGLFGGHKDHITFANATYYHLLNDTLNNGYMGTEESIFTIMSYLEPHVYKRYALDDNGLVVKFTQNLLDGNVELEKIIQKYNHPKGAYLPHLQKTSLYVLAFNFPNQFKELLKSFEKHDDWLDKPRKILINNTLDEDIIKQYDDICKEYGFEHIITGKNLGINRGRLLAAKHFDESDSDYYFFFEDDMCLHSPNIASPCRNGFRQFIPRLYEKAHHIMAREEFDFLKLSYTEVFMDNNIQVSWYNVPQDVRTEIWPEYDKLPTTGLDPRAPRTKFEHINVYDGVSYISGQIYYANWPMIVSKKGNKKMFIDVDWEYPYEQTWMSYMFQETINNNIKPAVLLASPINHNRIAHYTPVERREN